MDEIWKRQQGEPEKAFSAFLKFLLMEGGRTFVKVAELCGCSESLIRRWADRYDWRKRTRAYDNSKLDEVRQRVIQEQSARIMQQWLDCVALQTAAMTAFRAKDLSKASFKSLNEIYHAACERQAKLLEYLGVNGTDKGDDKNLTIKIIPATRKDVVQNSNFSSEQHQL